MNQRPLISFDWAIKKILRKKSNYIILEGFLTELLGFDIHILNIPESESNSSDKKDKINKVDILCENIQRGLILIELQYNSENGYFHRMLFGASKIITDYMSEGYTYDQVRKVYSINIVYFDLGHGLDYIYKGVTQFQGINNEDVLAPNLKQKQQFSINRIDQIYPEYYIIKVNKFNDTISSTLDEWIFYLKYGNLPKATRAQGLEEVKEILKYETMDAQAKLEYDAYQKELAISKDVIETAKMEGRDEGLEQGIEQGIEQGTENTKIQITCRSFDEGIDISTIAIITAQSEEEVKQILLDHKLIEEDDQAQSDSLN